MTRPVFLSRPFLPKLLRRMSTTTGEAIFGEIRNFLSRFTGGNVTLTRNLDTGIATMALDHPEKRNAMSGKMMVDFRDCVEELEKWDEGKAVILCGKGGNFCSGGDLDFARATGGSGYFMGTWMQDALKRLRRLPMISVCLANGPSLGGGAEISIFCDYLIVADNVRYGFVHGKMGIITAWGGGTMLSRRIGRNRALDLLLTARVLGSKECVEMGLAELEVDASHAFELTEKWLSGRVQLHHTLVRGFKDVVYKSDSETLLDCLEYEKTRFAPFWGSPTNKAALDKKIHHLKSQY